MTSTLTESPGWGEPGTIRHSEKIGHTVWLADHPRPMTDVPAELCHTRHCARPLHPLYEQHVDCGGKSFFSGGDAR